MNIQDALKASFTVCDYREIDRAQAEFNRLYNRYIGKGCYCNPRNYPIIVKQAWEKLQKAKG